ncbi:MAG: hypothetical protein KJ668_12175, partial [Proteobacteria bacterium]|nr:hypothetical protein [Pseudomonadota bacterium]
LIDFRLKKSSAPGTTIPGFSFFAYVTIYRYTKGFPRKIINLCHHIMLGLIIKNKTSVSYLFVKSCAKQVFPLQPYRRYSLVPAVVVALILIGGTLFFDKNKFADFILAALKGTPAPVEMPVKYVVKEMPQKTSEVLPPVVIPIVKPAIIEPSEKKQEPLHKLPEFYGSLRVPKDETLFNMIEAVYGSYKKEYLEKLLSSNLKIKNPDHINAGMRVDFPIINPMDTFWKNETVCIHFSKESEFKNAFLAARKYQKRGVNVRILPGWDSQKGFLFLVVVNQPFENLSEANTYKKKLNGITEAICEKISSCNDGRKIL